MIVMQSNAVKASLSEVLRKVEAGENIAITRHGRVVAYLSATAPVLRQTGSMADAVAKMRAFRRVRLAEGESIADMRAEGRR